MYGNSSREREQYLGSNDAPVTFQGYGGSTYGNYNTPPPLYPTSREREDAEYERQLQEATRQSQEEYIRQLEDDSRFYRMQYDSLRDMIPRGRYDHEAGPSGAQDSDSSDD
jgi:hypothetical protein